MSLTRNRWRPKPSPSTRRVPSRRVANGGERATVDGAGAVRLQREHVLAYGVALVSSEPIFGILSIVLTHPGVTLGLGQYGRCRNRKAQRIAADYPRLFDIDLGQTPGVNEKMLGVDPERLYRST